MKAEAVVDVTVVSLAAEQGENEGLDSGSSDRRGRGLLWHKAMAAHCLGMRWQGAAHCQKGDEGATATQLTQSGGRRNPTLSLTHGSR
jgi:hypothetical protein